MSTFGIGVENISSSVNATTFNSAASESLARCVTDSNLIKNSVE